MNPDDQRTSCPGFLDEYGVWNNGFECPNLAGQMRFCCGSESRRYCCALESLSKNLDSHLNRPIEQASYSTVDPPSFFAERKPLSIFTSPLLLTCLLGMIILFFVILFSLYCWYRCRHHANKRRAETLTTKTNLLVDHFPFSPPHHQFFLNETNAHYRHDLGLPHHPIKDTLTTTTTIASSTAASSSSSSGRTPSDIYFNDWKDFLISGEQPMNLYPTMSSYSNELLNDQQSNYLFHGKRQRHDVIV